MDLDRLQHGERLAALAAIVLLLVMMMFSWFAVDVPAEAREFVEMSGRDLGFNAFEAFEVIDLILLLTVAAAVGLAAAKAAGREIRLPVSRSALVAGLGILSTFLIFYRVLDPPGPGGPMGGIERRMGVFIGLLAAAGVAYGGWISMKAEGVSFAEEAERVQDRFAPDEEREAP